MNLRAFTIILGLGLSVPACDKGEEGGEAAASDESKSAATEAKPEPSPKVDEAAKAEAAKLAKLRDENLYPEDSLEKANAKAFLWLAWTAKDKDEQRRSQ